MKILSTSFISLVGVNKSKHKDKNKGVYQETLIDKNKKVISIDGKQLKQDLVNLPVSVVCEKYHLTLDELFNACSNMNNNNKKESDKYISRSNKMFKISRLFGRERISFGIYRNKKEARLVRDALVENDWDKDKLPEILEELDIKEIDSG